MKVSKNPVGATLAVKKMKGSASANSLMLKYGDAQGKAKVGKGLVRKRQERIKSVYATAGSKDLTIDLSRINQELKATGKDGLST